MQLYRICSLKEEKASLESSLSTLLDDKTAVEQERDSLESKLHSITAAGGSSDLIESLRKEVTALEEDALISIKQLSDKDADISDLQVLFIV